MTDDILHKAILNNIEWCEFVANSHGIANERLTNAWRATISMPPFYPNVISSVAATDSKELSLLADGLPEKCGWKDCFADLDLSEYGFSILFDAHWYALSGNADNPGYSEAVGKVTSAENLEEWIAAWGETPLNQPCLLYTSPSPRDLSTSRMPSSA